MAYTITVAFCKQKRLFLENESQETDREPQILEGGQHKELKNHIEREIENYLTGLRYKPKCEFVIFDNMDIFFITLQIDGTLIDDIFFIERIISIIKTEEFTRIAISQTNSDNTETDSYLSVIEAEKLIRICYDSEIIVNESFSSNLRDSMNKNLRILKSSICRCSNLYSQYYNNGKVYIINSQIGQFCARDFLLTALSEEQSGFCCRYGLEKYINDIHEQICDKDEILLNTGVTDVLKLLSKKVKELDDEDPYNGQLLLAIFRADAPIGFWSGKGASGYKKNLTKYIEIEKQARVIIFCENDNDHTDYHFPNKIVVDIAELYNNSQELKIINIDGVDSTWDIIKLYPNGITLFPSIKCAVIPELPQKSHSLRIMKSYHDFFEFKAKIVIGDKYKELREQFVNVYLSSAPVCLSRLKKSYRSSKIQELIKELYKTTDFSNINILCDKCESIDVSDNNIGVFVVHSMLKRIQNKTVRENYPDIRKLMIQALGGNLDSLYSLTNTKTTDRRNLAMSKVNNTLLISAIKKQVIFDHFWNPDIDKLLYDIIELDYMPTETMGYYGKKFEIELTSCSNDPLIKGFKASLVINFTSTTDQFNYEKATRVDDSNGDIFAINIFVKVTDVEHKQVATYKKCLWSKEPAEICGDPRYVKLLISDEV